MKNGSRARDLGVVIGQYEIGRYNAITDVAGVKVGQVTLWAGEGAHAVRTGVTVIDPAGPGIWEHKLPAGSFVLNGCGEVAGLMWVQESGILETPIALTNSLSVPDVQKGLMQWMLQHYPKIGRGDDAVSPLVMECDDSALNDIRGFHVKPEHVLAALNNSSTTEVKEGAVGAGTGMTTYEFKGGIGTSSRVVMIDGQRYTLGVLLNSNHGRRRNMRVKGIPVGELIPDLLPQVYKDGSIVVVIATDAPLDARQLSRLSKRAMLGLARTGGTAYHGSGDIALAFSTRNPMPHYPKQSLVQTEYLSDFFVADLFEAVADATEEAVLNSVFTSPTVVGCDGNTVHGIPHDRLRKLLD